MNTSLNNSYYEISQIIDKCNQFEKSNKQIHREVQQKSERIDKFYTEFRKYLEFKTEDGCEQDQLLKFAQRKEINLNESKMATPKKKDRKEKQRYRQLRHVLREAKRQQSVKSDDSNLVSTAEEQNRNMLKATSTVNFKTSKFGLSPTRIKKALERSNIMQCKQNFTSI